MNTGYEGWRTTNPRKRAEWVVRSNEGDQVGPVCLDLIERGLYTGRVPEDAMIARVGSGDWSPVLGILPPPAQVSYASTAAILDDSIEIPKQDVKALAIAYGPAFVLSLVVTAYWLAVALAF